MKSFKEYRRQQIEEGKFADFLSRVGGAIGHGLGRTGEFAWKHGKELVKSAGKAVIGQIVGRRYHYDHGDYEEGKDKGKEEAERDRHLSVIRSHASASGFDPMNDTSMSGYHAFMGMLTRGGSAASHYPRSGLAWDATASGRRGSRGAAWRGANPRSSNLRIQSAAEHDAAKQSWEWLKNKGHI